MDATMLPLLRVGNNSEHCAIPRRVALDHVWVAANRDADGPCCIAFDIRRHYVPVTRTEPYACIFGGFDVEGLIRYANTIAVDFGLDELITEKITSYDEALHTCVLHLSRVAQQKYRLILLCSAAPIEARAPVKRSALCDQSVAQGLQCTILYCRYLQQQRFQATMERRLALGLLATVLPALLAASALGAPSDSVVRAVRLSERELLLVTTAPALRWREDFTASSNQLRIELEGIRPADSVRELAFPAGSAFTALFVRNKPSGCLVLVERSSGLGYVISPVPYSQSLYIRAVNWDDPGERLLAYGIDAWSKRRYSRAEGFWRSALARGQREASQWLGLAKALEGSTQQARDYLEPLVEQKAVLPDALAALAGIYEAASDTRRASALRERFVQVVGRPPSQPPLLEQANAEDTTLLSPLDIFVAREQAAAPPAAADSTSSPPGQKTSGDSDLFAQLRRLQGRNDTTQAQQSASAPPWSVSLPLLAAGGTLVFIGIILLRGYFRWRRNRIAQLAEALAQQVPPPAPPPPEPSVEDTPLPPFDELLKLIEEPIEQQPNHSSAAPRRSVAPQPVEDEEPELFDFDEDTYRTIREQQATQHIDEQLLYPSQSTAQPSQKDPAATSRELTEQERDLARAARTPQSRIRRS